MASTDPREVALRSAALTKQRYTSVTFDHAEQALTESFQFLHRAGRQIHPAGVTRCLQLKCGVWILSPLQGFSMAHESAAAQVYTLRLTDFAAHPTVVEVPHFRQVTELTGISPGTDTPAVPGDFFLTKRIAAGDTWANALAGPDPLASELSGDLGYPMDQLVKSLQTHDGMTGYLLKLWIPGGAFDFPDYAMAFQFGGELYGSGATPHTGYGKFMLALTGDGQAILWEWIDGGWQEAGRWRAYDAVTTTPSGLIVRIIPAWPRFLEITTSPHIEPSKQLVPLLAQTAFGAMIAARGDFKNNTFVYDVTNRGPQGLATGPGYLAPITGQGQVSVWIRRDLRALFQVNRLGYPASGFIIDRPFTLRGGVEDAHVIAIKMKGYNHIPSVGVGATTTLDGEVQEQQDTGLTVGLTPASETFTYAGASRTRNGWNPPGGENKLAAILTLGCLESAGSRIHTPFLTGYSLTRNGHVETFSPGEKTGGSVTSVSLVGPAYEPDHESASIAIEDLSNELSFLRARGKASVRIETTFDAAGTDKCVVFEGYIGRVTSMLKGKLGRVYPSPDEHSLDVQCAGKWDRLNDRFFFDLYNFQFESDSPTGITGAPGDNTDKSWKVTDIIRFVLWLNGVPDNQIDVPDIDLRIFAPTGQAAVGTLQVMPGMSVKDFLQTLARDYLNAWIFWEPNAKTAGMWRLKLAPDGTETPVWNFVNTNPSSPPKLTYLSAAYPARTSRILGPDESHPLRSYVVPPEGNLLYVIGGADPRTGETVRRTVKNQTSWDGPTHTTADDTDLDFLGRMTEIFYVDVTLTTQEAVDFIARRVFSTALRGRKFVEFTAEFVLLDMTDAAAPGYEPTIFTTKKRRPIRAGDLITIDGTVYIVHSVNPIWRNDGFQLAFYETELFREQITFQ